MNQIKNLLLQAPDTQICPQTKNKIKQWSTNPTALEILETLDFMVHGSTGSAFAVITLETLLNQTLNKENKSLDDLIPLAHWRNKN